MGAERGTTVTHGWKPESGFLPWRWEGFDEALVLYVLGLGSPTHPLPVESYAAWSSTYEWKTSYGHDYLYAGPLFTHQISHVWIDFRGIQDAYMPTRDRLLENTAARPTSNVSTRSKIPSSSRVMARTAGDHRERRARPPHRQGAGIERPFLGYVARGVPYGPATAPWPVGRGRLASIAPEIVLPTIDHLVHHLKLKVGNPYGFKATFKSTYPEKSGRPNGWVSPWHYGINQGPSSDDRELLDGLVWRLMRGFLHRHRPTPSGLRRRLAMTPGQPGIDRSFAIRHETQRPHPERVQIRSVSPDLIAD